MKRCVRRSVHVLVPVELVFEYVSDYRNLSEWMFGTTSFLPVTERDRGVGAGFAAEMVVGSKVLHSTIEVVEWEQDTVIAVEWVGGGGNVSRWRFDAVSRHETRLTVEFNYVPAGPTRALALVSEPVIGAVIRHAEAALCRRVEESYYGEG